MTGRSGTTDTAPGLAERERAALQRLRDTLPRTLGGLLDWRVEHTPHRPAYHLRRSGDHLRRSGDHLRRSGDAGPLSWAQATAVVDEVAAGLLLLGLPAGAVVALSSSARVETVLLEWAAARAAAVSVGLHPAAPSGQVRDLLGRSEARVLVAEDADQLAKVREHWPRMPHLSAVVVLDSSAVGPGSVHAGDQRVLSWDALRARGRAALGVDPDLVADVVAQVRPADTAALVDTAGPDDPPRLVTLSHDAWVWQAATVAATVAATGRVDERDTVAFCLPVPHHLGRTWRAAQLVLGFPSATADDLDQLVADLPMVRPRVVVALPPTVQRGLAHARLRLAGDRRQLSRVARWALGEADDDRSPQQALAAAVVLPRLRAGLGGRLRYVVCGTAAVDAATRTWFARLGVQVLDGTGCPAGHGTAPDGGWPPPGPDLPAGAVEARFAALCPYVGHLVRFGEPGARVALVTLDADAMVTWGQQHGMAGERYQQVVAAAPVRTMLQRCVDRLNAELPDPERVLRFVVLPDEFTVADGALAWDLSVRRRTLAHRHAQVLAELGTA